MNLEPATESGNRGLPDSGSRVPRLVIAARIALNRFPPLTHLWMCGGGYGMHVIAVPERWWEIAARHGAATVCKWNKARKRGDEYGIERNK